MALLTLVIAFLLVRRVVNPLAEVIAASQRVATGDLKARTPIGQAHDDMQALGENFNAMAEAIELADSKRRNLLADIAHELRTPLTVLRGRLEGILDGVYPADEAHIAPVLEETYLLERLVDDLRLLTLAESRQLHFDPRSCDLGELAQRCTSLFSAQAVERDITLELKVVGGLQEVQADPQRVEQVIGNLVANAIHYTPVGGKVIVLVRPEHGGVQLAVQDNGPGVSEGDLPHIFDRFWRGDKSRSRVTGGAGLGLAISRHLVEMQGGRISAQNLPSGGLEVSLWFPA
jgi:two-component system OmpR family sensor kinase/two-component system sensor histidine kinase BaeS